MKLKLLPYIVIALFTFFISIVRYFLIPEWDLAMHFLVFCLQFLFLILVWLLIGRISKFLDKHLPFRTHIIKRIALQIVLSLLIISPGFMFVIVYYKSYLPTYATPQFIAIILVLFAIFVVLINFIYYFRYAFQQWQQSIVANAQLEVQTAELEKERSMMQYHHLKNQVNPHFLFNTFTSLDGLIQTSPELASDFVRHLSKVYRYVLEHKEKEVVSLQTEVDFIQHYIFLLQIRYKEVLHINLSISPEALEKGIVMVTLQMLIDNAVKHNSLQPDAPLRIHITDDEGYLKVVNNKQLRKQIETSNKQGLQQLKELYAYLTPHPVIINDKADTFEINLPLL